MYISLLPPHAGHTFNCCAGILLDAIHAIHAARFFHVVDTL